MRITFILWATFVLNSDVPAVAQADKERVFVLTDISNEPDDEESMVRFLVYANEYDIEGLVATTSTWLRENPREDLIRRQLYAYNLVRSNLKKHASGYPTSQSLLEVTSTGQPTYGMEAVGDGKSSAGSRLLEAAVDRVDDRALWVSVWGGANTLAQTLWDVRQERSLEEVEEFVSKIKVYTISDQDDAGPWIRKAFPQLFYVVSPSAPDAMEYYEATWTGISGDLFYRNGPYYMFHMVENPWLKKNVINNHGPLGQLYPPLEYIMEGDTPSFLGLINNGLGWTPSNGGWAGRYDLHKAAGESRPIWTNNRKSRDCIKLGSGNTHCSEQATIWRWREHFQNDFAARMDWCIQESYEGANHNPIALLNQDDSKDILELTGKAGSRIHLSAQGSSDPDNNTLAYRWYVYPELSLPARHYRLIGHAAARMLEIDQTCPVGDIHVILEVKDNGYPSLVSYRRAIIHINE